MAVITPFTTTTVTTAALRVATMATTTTAASALAAPAVVGTIFYQRVYGVTINITDDGVETLDVLTTVAET